MVWLCIYGLVQTLIQIIFRTYSELLAVSLSTLKKYFFYFYSLFLFKFINCFLIKIVQNPRNRYTNIYKSSFRYSTDK